MFTISELFSESFSVGDMVEVHLSEVYLAHPGALCWCPIRVIIATSLDPLPAQFVVVKWKRE